MRFLMTRWSLLGIGLMDTNSMLSRSSKKVFEIWNSKFTDIFKYVTICILLAVSLASCIAIPYAVYNTTHTVAKEDVTDKEEYHHYYELNQVYRFRHDSMILPEYNPPKIEEYLKISPRYSRRKIREELLNTSKRGKRYRQTIDEHSKEPALIQQGTQFTITKFYKMSYKNYGTTEFVDYLVIGKLLDGPFKGTVFQLEDLSHKVYDKDKSETVLRPKYYIELIE